MRSFDTEAARLIDPIGSLIPPSFWELPFPGQSVFSRASQDLPSFDHLSNEHEQLLSSPLMALDSLLNTPRQRTKREKIEWWLCVAWGHKEAADDQLITVARALGMSSGDILCATSGLGRVSLIDNLTTGLSPKEIQTLLKNNPLAIAMAVQGNHEGVIDKLIALFQESRSSMQRLSDAIFSRKTFMIELLIKPSATYNLLQIAAACNHLSILTKLFTFLSRADQKKLAAANDYAAFTIAAGNDHFTFLQRLMPYLNNQDRRTMGGFAQQYILNALACQGDLEGINTHLRDIEPTPLQIHDPSALRAAAKHGHLSVFNRLLEFYSSSLDSVLLLNDYEVFRVAVAHHHGDIINRLLQFPRIFNYALTHTEYDSYTEPFIANKLAYLHRKIEEEGAITVTLEEIKNYVYILRHLIFRNDPALLPEIRFLLSFPALTSTEEFIDLCDSFLVQEAPLEHSQTYTEIQALLVQALNRGQAQLQRPRNAAELRTIATNRESSMQALTSKEQARLAEADARYKPQIEAMGGVDEAFNQLMQALQQRYEANPAKINVSGKEIHLPLTWPEFNTLELTPSKRRQALNAYYNHATHTALRFLSVPNEWIHPNASYVYINDARTERWAMFDDFKPLIVMLWLAANDEAVEPIDGHTLEGRVENFLKSLALIGRAHNWDKTQRTANGSSEEYDDGEADRPSCQPGMKRRLFQSIIGHPLFKILTEELIKQELNSFIRAQMRRQITEKNRLLLWETWRKLVNLDIEPESAEAASLKIFNISSEQKEAFIEDMKRNYGAQFTSDEAFKAIIDEALPISASDDVIHVHTCGHIVDVNQLLAPPQRFIQAYSKFEQAMTALAHSREHLAAKLSQPHSSNKLEALKKMQEAAGILHDELTKAQTTYFADPTHDNYLTFKQTCEQSLKKARPVLDNNLGCKEILCNLALAIIGLGVFYAIAVGINYAKNGRLSFFPSAEAKNLDLLQNSLSHLEEPTLLNNTC